MEYTQVKWLSLLLYTVYWFAISITDVPTVALVERAICIQKHQGSNIDEAVCKSADIQSALANTLGWKLSFSSFAGLLTAIYYGLVAERRGKKLVLLLSTYGYVAMMILDILICSLPSTFPVKAIWISSALLLVGGGQRVYTSMIYALVSDSLESDQRTTQLYFLGLGSNVIKFIAPRISALLMQIRILAPFYASFIAFGAVLVLITLVVEEKVSGQKKQSQEYTPIPSRDSTDDSQVIGQASPNSPDALDDAPSDDTADKKSKLTNLRDEIQAFCTFFRTPATLYCLAATFLKRIGFASSVFAPQYVSEKFGWELYKTTWLRVSGSGGAILIYVIAPVLNAWLIKRGTLPQRVDLNAIRGSLLILTISFFAAWRASSGTFMIIATFGMGLGETLQPALQGLVTFVTGSHRNTRVFTTLALADTAAELIAGPLVAALMAIGRTEDHTSDGLLFCASSAIFAILFLWTFLFKIP